MLAQIKQLFLDWRFFAAGFIVGFFVCVIWQSVDPDSFAKLIYKFEERITGRSHFLVVPSVVGLASVIFLPDIWREPKNFFQAAIAGVFMGITVWIMLGIFLAAYITIFESPAEDGSIFEQAFFFYFVRMLGGMATLNLLPYFAMSGSVVVVIFNQLARFRKITRP